jgi:hypothetical protein
MTRYSYDAAGQTLIAAWATGRGDLAHTVARIPAGSTEHQCLDIASALAALSTVLWRAYTHPAVAAGDPDQADTEAWRRAESRAAFAMVPEWVAHPNLPTVDGLLTVAYDPVEESANRVGRALHAIGDPDLAEAVAGEVETEIAAVQSAELGDLVGRSQQAVMLTRADASPVQVAAAHELLAADPLGSSAVFTDLDPTAAAVAAAHWLGAAAEITAARTGVDPTQVVVEADDLEALPVRTPTLVLERLSAGENPRAIVIDLVDDAMHVAEGRLRDPEEVVARVAQINLQTAGLGEHAEAVRQALLGEFRASALDPARPSLDLLEDLLGGIHGCRLLYHEHGEYEDAYGDGDGDDDDGDVDVDGDGTADEGFDATELENDEAAAEQSERIDAEFLAEIRAAAQAGSFLL